MPTVGWIIPVHNGAPTLEAALRSIAGQTFGDFEALVVNDGSTDGSAEIIRLLCAQDRRFRCLQKPKSGIVDTLNLGLFHCAGRYVARMDADDLCEPDRLERQVAYMEAHPACVAAGSRVLVIDGAGRPVRRSRGNARAAPGPGGFPTGGITLTHPSVIGRTAAFRQVGGYRHGFAAAEDYDLWLRLHRLGDVVEMPDYLLRYRVHPNSVSAQNLHEQRLSCLKAEIVDCLSGLDGAEKAISAIIASDTPEALFERAERSGANLPDAAVLRLYFWSQTLRRATYRLPAAESLRIAARTSALCLRQMTRRSSPSSRFFLVRAASEILRWMAVTASLRNREAARF